MDYNGHCEFDSRHPYHILRSAGASEIPVPRVVPRPPEYYIRSKIMDNMHHFDSEALFTRIMIGLTIGVAIFVALGL